MQSIPIPAYRTMFLIYFLPISNDFPQSNQKAEKNFSFPAFSFHVLFAEILPKMLFSIVSPAVSCSVSNNFPLLFPFYQCLVGNAYLVSELFRSVSFQFITCFQYFLRTYILYHKNLILSSEIIKYLLFFSVINLKPYMTDYEIYIQIHDVHLND